MLWIFLYKCVELQFIKNLFLFGEGEIIKIDGGCVVLIMGVKI